MTSSQVKHAEYSRRYMSTSPDSTIEFSHLEADMLDKHLHQNDSLIFKFSLFG